LKSIKAFHSINDTLFILTLQLILHCTTFIVLIVYMYFAVSNYKRIAKLPQPSTATTMSGVSGKLIIKL